MSYFLNDNAIGLCTGKEYAKKGAEVSLIATHGDMAIVDSGVEKFPVKFSMLSQKEVVEVVAAENKAEPRVIHPTQKKTNKKQVTNPTNNIQSLF